MITSYLKTSWRSIARNKLFSAINIIGLATSMSVGLLLIAIIHDMHQYDRFHTKSGSIYRVITDYSDLDGNTIHMATTSVKAGKMIHEKFPEVKDLVILQHGFGGEFRFGDQAISIEGLWAEPALFDIFSFRLVKGNPATALTQPNSIVLTEKTATKLFGNSDPVGKTITLNDKTPGATNAVFLVTGVLKDVSKFSHLQFEALGSFSTLETGGKDNTTGEWNNIWSNYVYVLLRKDGIPGNLQTKLNGLSEKENKQMTDKGMQLSLLLQPLEKIALGKRLENQTGPVMSSGMLWFMTGLAFIVLLSACFNYTNLSIAKSLKRSREIGVRKVIGARKFHVFIQFVLEALIISLVSLILAFAVFILIRAPFLSLSSNLGQLLTLDLTLSLGMYFILFAVFIGVIAGFLPALFYMKIKAIKVIRNISHLKIAGRLNMKKVLTVIQYTFSIIFITSTLIIYNQYKHFLSFDLGFKTKNVLNIKLGEADSELLKKELSEIPEITNISRSFMITSVGNNYYTYLKYTDPQDSVRVWYNKIDENYIPLFRLELISGHNFSARPEGTEEEVIVNEKVISTLKIGEGDPNRAVGEFTIVDGKRLKIAGVVRNFHFSTADKEIGPFLFRYTAKEFHYMNAGIVSTNLPATMAKVEKAWKRVETVHPMNAQFYDDMIQQAYSEYSSMAKSIGFLAFLAIVIASVGLLGMVVFSTQTRLREISIRKVFGAGSKKLVYLLIKGFLFLLILSCMIAIPVTYFLFNKFILKDIVYHSPIGFFELFSGAFTVMIIALVIIGSQALKATRVNPAEVLKNES